MKYKIVHGDDEDELTERVNEAMKEGWIAQGGLVVLINTFSKGSYPVPYHGGETKVWEPYSAEWHQAMIKTTEGYQGTHIKDLVPPPDTGPVSELGW